jgi:hypothetical protein
VIFAADAYARDGRRFTVLADERLSAFWNSSRRFALRVRSLRTDYASFHRGIGRNSGVGRRCGVGRGLGVALGIDVAVGVTVGGGVCVAVGEAVDVGVEVVVGVADGVAQASAVALAVFEYGPFPHAWL